MTNSFPQVEFPHILATVVTMVITNEHKMKAWTKLLSVCTHMWETVCWEVDDLLFFIVSEIHQWYTLWKKYISASHSWAILPQCKGLFSVALHYHSGWESLDTEPTQRQQSSWHSHFPGGSFHDFSTNSAPLASQFYVLYTNCEPVLLNVYE